MEVDSQRKSTPVQTLYLRSCHLTEFTHQDMLKNENSIWQATLGKPTRSEYNILHGWNINSILPRPIRIRMNLRLRNVFPLLRLDLTINTKSLISLSNHRVERELPRCRIARH